MSKLSKVFSLTYQVSWLFLGFLGFFNGMVSVDVFENIVVEFYVLRPFKRYIICRHY